MLKRAAAHVALAAYSCALAAFALASLPYWLLRTRRGGLGERFRERLGAVPASLRASVRGRRVVWLHAVSVGEVLAAERLVRELEAALGEGWCVVVSTTTAAGDALARERFGAERTFRFPLDWAFAVRAYLRALAPAMLVLTESELWPRMLFACAARGVPVAVINARVSDRSFRRGLQARMLWRHILGAVTLLLAQTETDAERLRAMGAAAERVRVSGNLKFDVSRPSGNRVAELIRKAAGTRPIVVAGSTCGAESNVFVDLQAELSADGAGRPITIVAPRQPAEFDAVHSYALHLVPVLASELLAQRTPANDSDIIVLDTIGDLASVYSVASVAFVGGSLLPRGGHNPLEPAMWGVPIVMGPSYENFRGIVEALRAADAIRIVQNDDELEATVRELLRDPVAAQAMGARARGVFEAQGGAVQRTVAALLPLLESSHETVQQHATDAVAEVRA